MKHIEAVVTCSRYADYLRVTLPYTLNAVDHLVVVTSNQPFDDDCRALCKLHGVKCISTDAFFWAGAAFAKGRAINKGLDQLCIKDWVLHLDADIVLPNSTRRMLNKIELDPQCIYGVNRVECSSAAAWSEFESSRQQQYQYHCLVQSPPQFPLMGNYVHQDDGYVPIGFFQLWNAATYKHSYDKRYPDRGNEAIHTDVQHAIQWDGPYRRLIPEIIAIHLCSVKAPIGANWRGRQTPEFKPGGPPPAPPAVPLRSYYDRDGTPTGANPNVNQRTA